MAVTDVNFNSQFSKTPANLNWYSARSHSNSLLLHTYIYPSIRHFFLPKTEFRIFQSFILAYLHFQIYFRCYFFNTNCCDFKFPLKFINSHSYNNKKKSAFFFCIIQDDANICYLSSILGYYLKQFNSCITLFALFI